MTIQEMNFERNKALQENRKLKSLLKDLTSRMKSCIDDNIKQSTAMEGTPYGSFTYSNGVMKIWIQNINKAIKNK